MRRASILLAHALSALRTPYNALHAVILARGCETVGVADLLWPMERGTREEMQGVYGSVYVARTGSAYCGVRGV